MILAEYCFLSYSSNWKDTYMGVPVLLYNIKKGGVMRRSKYTDEQLRLAIEESFSYSQVFRKLGLRPAGGTHNFIKEKVKKLGLDTSHFSKYKLSIIGGSKNRQPASNFLKKGIAIRGSALKKKLIQEGYFKDICSICGQSPEWNGKPMVLELDHIDGDIYNNELCNLRILCLHCHSQTATWRKIKNIKIYNCLKCGCKITKYSIHKMCRSCFNKSRDHSYDCRKIKDRPSIEILTKDILEIGYCATGRKYGVSDNAIRKWIKGRPSGGIWQTRQT